MAKPTRYTQAMMEEYIAKGWWERATLADIYDRNAREFPDKEAFVDTRRRATWGELKRMTDRIALGVMELGLERDQAVISYLPSCVEDIALRIGLEKAGVIHVSAPITLGEAELDHFLQQTGAVAACTVWEYHGSDRYQILQNLRSRHPQLRHIFVIGEQVPEGAISLEAMMQEPLEERYPQALLQERRFTPFEVSHLKATTGTTGMPKLCEMVVGAEVRIGMCVVEGLRVTRDDVGLALTHTMAGISSPVVDGVPMVGAKGVLIGSFDPEEVLRLIERERVTYMIGVPVHYARLIRHPSFGHYDLSSLRLAIWAGAFMTISPEELEEKLGCPVLNMYGAVDARAHFFAPPEAPREIRLYTAGKPCALAEVKLLDEEKREVPPGEPGEIHWRGPCGAGGYYRDPEATKAAWGALGPEGFFNLKDLGRFDEEGNLILLGRREDIINRGGQNIYPVEIENLLGTHPKIQDVCVVAMPDPELGERACAFVVPKEGEELSFQEMVDFLLEKRIAKYKLPERLELRRELPMVGPGKVNRKLLEQEIAQILRAEGKI